LDSLILNGTKLNNSSKCNSANPWLNCLQSGSTFPLEKCKDSYEIMFSYNYNDAELYTGSITGDSIGLPQVFNHTFKLICKLIKIAFSLKLKNNYFETVPKIHPKLKRKLLILLTILLIQQKL
jgi:hypothetical protein